MMKDMRRNSNLPHLFQVAFIFVFFIMLFEDSSAKVLKRKIKESKRPSEIKTVQNISTNESSDFLPQSNSSNSIVRTILKKTPKRRKNQHKKRLTRHTRSSFLTSRHHDDERTEIIKNAILTLPELHQLLAPIKWHGNLDGLIGPSDYGHLRGTVRLKRLYCRVGIGYHLEITKKGKVTARHLPTSDGIMEIFSVKRRVVGIRSVAYRDRYLCMNKSGRVVTRKRFQPSCEFRENLESNRYNTYASERYSKHTKREGYFLAINKNGKLPKRMKHVSWKQRRAHWLPRSV